VSEPTLETVRRIVADVFNLPIDEVLPTSSPETIESWDSEQHLNLVLAVEQEFGVQLAPEDIEQFASVGEIAKLLLNRPQRT
jgi:acyl carrier protein